ncbi:MAG TPA: LysR substrate-binding domain-containing protein, partial [Halioglobus sp.]
LGQPAQPDLIARRLVTIGFGLYANKDYLRRAAPLNSVDDLKAHQLVGLQAAGTAMNSPMMFPPSPSVAGNYVYLTNSSAAQLSAVKAGFGVGILSHRWAAMAGAGKLTRVLPEYTAATVDLWLVTHEELRHSARIRAVFDFIADRVLADADLFERGTRI